MKFWIRINGLQEGPMDIEQLKAQKITPTTYVWCAGMKDWAYARDVADLQDIITTNCEREEPENINPQNIVTATENSFSPATEPVVTETHPEQTQEANPYEQKTELSAEEQHSPQAETIQKEPVQPTFITTDTHIKSNQPVYERPCPSNNMVWAILTTIFCCQPLGIVAIILAAQVSSKYYESGYDTAKKYSDWTAILCIANIVLAILLASVFTPLLLFAEI